MSAPGNVRGAQRSLRNVRVAQRSLGNVRGALRALIAADARLLLVGARNYGHAQALELPQIGALPPVGQRFDAAIWCPDGDLVRGVKLLRTQLRPGAPLVLWAEPTGLAARVWSSLARAPARTRLSLEEACEALVLGGLCGPRLLAVGSLGFAVTASLPALPDALDTFFEQPAV